MFSFIVGGTHCEGCFKLIQMTLEDYKFTNILIYSKLKLIKLESSEKNLEKTKKLLDLAFEELEGYTFNNLKSI